MKLTLELRRSHVISFINCLENELCLVIMLVPVFLSLSLSLVYSHSSLCLHLAGVDLKLCWLHFVVTDKHCWSIDNISIVCTKELYCNYIPCAPPSFGLIFWSLVPAEISSKLEFWFINILYAFLLHSQCRMWRATDL